MRTAPRKAVPFDESWLEPYFQSGPVLPAVERFHKERLKAGGHDYGAPGVGADYNPTYYAAFLIDPDGNNVEAVCVRP